MYKFRTYQDCEVPVWYEVIDDTFVKVEVEYEGKVVRGYVEFITIEGSVLLSLRGYDDLNREIDIFEFMPDQERWYFKMDLESFIIKYRSLLSNFMLGLVLNYNRKVVEN